MSRRRIALTRLFRRASFRLPQARRRAVALPVSYLRPAPLAQSLLLIAPILLFSIIAHEYAHGYAALKQGDTTASKLGRLTWNPIKHIDPWMSIFLPLMLYAAHLPILAGAKPVPINPSNYRNYKRGDIIVSLAGIATNVALALACTIVVAITGFIGEEIPAASGVCSVLQAMAWVGIGLNLILAMFNLLPVPPLDGSHVLKYLLPPALAQRYQQIGFAGIVIVLILLYTPAISYWLFPAYASASLLQNGLRSLVLPETSQLLSAARF
jgi:Zn-dependent protease